MTERYLGSIISPSPTEPSSNLSNTTASGVWNIHDPLIFGQAGDWPDPTNVPSVGLTHGGSTDVGYLNTVQKFIPESAGDATDFGDLSAAKYSVGSFSSDTRSVVSGGSTGSAINVIEYFTFASAGDATDFGDMSAVGYGTSGLSNNVRGVFYLGRSASNTVVNTIEYVTIASTGNATDFGDLTGTREHGASVASSTRGVFAGSNNYTNVIEYITIVSTSNATDFGDLTVGRGYMSGGANSSTRGVFGLGYTGSYNNTLDYITIASTGNATDFGDAVALTYYTSGTSNSTKGLFIGGQDSSGVVNVIQQITIATTGNATDFGDLFTACSAQASTCSANPAVQNEAGFPPAAIGLLAGGDGINSAGYQTAVIFLNITTDGQSGMFGELSAKTSRMALGTAASSTRGISRIGGSPNYTVTNELEYNTFSTKGAVTDFGDLTSGSVFGGALSNSTRGVVALGKAGTAGGEGTQSNTIDYFTIASAGNATDFGDLTITNQYLAGVAGTTRGIFAGGQPSGSYTDVIEYITIASTGNGTDFGDLIETNFSVGMVSSNTRAVMGSGGRSSNQMQYVTIASTGNATDFGDATGSASYNYTTGLSGSTIGLFHNYNSTYNVDKITIASTGDATDWGDLTWGAGQVGGTSNAHGGL
jgi:hypothetical protein